MMNRIRYRVIAILSVMFCACFVSSSHVDVQNRISVTVANGENDDFFDVGDARLLRALQETETVVGHPVQFAFNYAMLPNPRAQFLNTFFEHSIRLIPRELASLQDRTPLAFNFAAPDLHRIAFDYDGSRRSTDVRFYRDTGILVIRLNGPGHIPRGVVADAIRTAFRNELVVRYQNMQAQEVDSSEYELYLHYLTEYSQTGAQQLSGDARVWFHPKARAIINGVQFYNILGNHSPDLHQQLHNWLLQADRFFESQRASRSAVVARAPADSPFRHAERAWAQWVTAVFDNLTDQEQRNLLPDLFVPGPSGSRSPGDQQVFPGIDIIALWLRVVDRWIAAGAPVAADEDSDALPQALYEHAVCPYRPPTTGFVDEGIHCRSNVLYRAMINDFALFERVIEATLSRNHTGLTAALTQRVMKHGTADQILHLWNRFSGNETHYLTATRVIAAHFAHGRRRIRRDFFRYVAPKWRAEPHHQGPLLYLIACLDHPDGGNPNLVRWDRFADIFGAPISREAFGSFLDQGILAFNELTDIWPALDRFSRAAVLLPRIEQLIQTQNSQQSRSDSPATLLRIAVRLMQESGDSADINRVNSWLRARIQAHPEEEIQWRNLLSATSR